MSRSRAAPHASGRSDLHEMAEVCAGYCPARAGRLREAARYGHDPVAGRAVPRRYFDGLGPRLAQEYTRVHDTKSTRASA
ncbi:hypothetical protein [Streptomyces sp. NPDC014006]|uniref:hypothetical protein n=1 Tax=Streptomyces sp. NPDC014006 TaxID=3364870 RepID=UPI0036F6C5CB